MFVITAVEWVIFNIQATVAVAAPLQLACEIIINKISLAESRSRTNSFHCTHFYFYIQSKQHSQAPRAGGRAVAYIKISQIII